MQEGVAERRVTPSLKASIADETLAKSELIGPKALTKRSSCERRDQVQAIRLRISPPGSTWYRITRFWSIR